MTVTIEASDINNSLNNLAFDSSDPQSIDSSEFEELLKRRQDVVVIDVRSPGEFQSVHIEGSYNIPIGEIKGSISKIASKISGPVVLICQAGIRSEQAAEILNAAGVQDIRILEGGIGAWRSFGGQVAIGQGRWAMDRQVRLISGSVVMGGIALGSFPKLRFVRLLPFLVGVGLVHSSVTNSCLLARLLGRLSYNKGPRYDLDSVLDLAFG